MNRRIPNLSRVFQAGAYGRPNVSPWSPLSATSATLLKWWDASLGQYSDTSGTPSTLTGAIKRWVARYPLDGSAYIDSGAVGRNPTWQQSAGGVYYVLGDGSDDYMQGSWTAIPQPFTVFFICSPVTTAADHDRALDSAGASRSFIGGNAAAGASRKWQYYAGSVQTGTEAMPSGSLNSVLAIFNGASSKLIVNNVTSSTANPGTASQTGFTLFTDNALSAITNWSARVSHIGIYGGALDATDQANFHGFAVTKDPS